MKNTRIVAGIIASTLTLIGLTACTDKTADSADNSANNKTVKVLAYDSFSLDKKLIDEFEKSTGQKLQILSSGGGGELVNKLVLTKDTPVADAVFGIDNAFAGRVLKEKIIQDPKIDLPKGVENYTVSGGSELVPIDHGQVCLNADKEWFKNKGLEEPKNFDDLTKPEYKDLFAGINPTTSSAGLGFFLATIAEKQDAWKEYWQALKDNGLSVAKDWSTAYNVDFTAGEGNGSKPIVVSYATSPLETLENDRTRTYTLESTCYDQIEYAGIIKNAANAQGAKLFIEFMLSKKVQDTLLESMYVFPVIYDAKISEEVMKFTPPVKNALHLSPIDIEENRETWLKEWNELISK